MCYLAGMWKSQCTPGSCSAGEAFQVAGAEGSTRKGNVMSLSDSKRVKREAAIS